VTALSALHKNAPKVLPFFSIAAFENYSLLYIHHICENKIKNSLVNFVNIY